MIQHTRSNTTQEQPSQPTRSPHHALLLCHAHTSSTPLVQGAQDAACTLQGRARTPRWKKQKHGNASQHCCRQRTDGCTTPKQLQLRAVLLVAAMAPCMCICSFAPLPAELLPLNCGPTPLSLRQLLHAPFPCGASRQASAAFLLCLLCVCVAADQALCGLLRCRRPAAPAAATPAVRPAGDTVSSVQWASSAPVAAPAAAAGGSAPRCHMVIMESCG